jgi:hypothetical protein
MALLLAGVHSLQVAYIHNALVLHFLSLGDAGTFIKTL